MYSPLRLLAISFILVFFTACAPESSGTSSGGTSSGGSSSGSSYGSQLQGTWKLISPDPGGNVTISFSSSSDSGTGSNVIDVPGFQPETRTYTYSISGDVLTFVYTNTSGTGTPSTIVSVTSSTLTLHNSDNSTGIYSKVGSSSSGSAGVTSACETNQTGELMVYATSDNGGGVIAVKIDGRYAGTLTTFLASGTATCGGSAGITKTLSAGSHTVSASNSIGTWPSSSYSVRVCGCVNVALQ